MRGGTSAVYDRQHRYVIDHDRDPAYPDLTPEPTRKATVGGARNIPVARSWCAWAEPVHHELVGEMRLAQPARHVTRVVGWGDHSAWWMVCNDGPDGNGQWWIPHSSADAAAAVEEARRARGRPAVWGRTRRAVLALVAAAAFVLAAWMTIQFLGAGHAPEQTRLLIGVLAIAPALIFIATAVALARHPTPRR